MRLRKKQALEMSDILLELLCVSEKAANIARACRQQETLFQLLIEEKKGAEKNKKFAMRPYHLNILHK